MWGGCIGGSRYESRQSFTGAASLPRSTLRVAVRADNVGVVAADRRDAARLAYGSGKAAGQIRRLRCSTVFTFISPPPALLWARLR